VPAFFPTVNSRYGESTDTRFPSTFLRDQSEPALSSYKFHPRGTTVRQSSSSKGSPCPPRTVSKGGWFNTPVWLSVETNHIPNSTEVLQFRLKAPAIPPAIAPSLTRNLSWILGTLRFLANLFV